MYYRIACDLSMTYGSYAIEVLDAAHRAGAYTKEQYHAIRLILLLW